MKDIQVIPFLHKENNDEGRKSTSKGKSEYIIIIKKVAFLKYGILKGFFSLQDSFHQFTLIGLKIRLQFMWTAQLKPTRRMQTALTMIMKMWSSLLEDTMTEGLNLLFLCTLLAEVDRLHKCKHLCCIQVNMQWI